MPPTGATCEPDHQPFDPSAVPTAARAAVVADALPQAVKANL